MEHHKQAPHAPQNHCGGRRHRGKSARSIASNLGCESPCFLGRFASQGEAAKCTASSLNSERAKLEVLRTGLRQEGRRCSLQLQLLSKPSVGRQLVDRVLCHITGYWDRPFSRLVRVGLRFLDCMTDLSAFVKVHYRYLVPQTDKGRVFLLECLLDTPLSPLRYALCSMPSTPTSLD